MQLRPVTYRYNFEADQATQSIGFLAQDVQELFPELVASRKSRDTGESYLSLNYGGFSVLAIQALKEQQIAFENLKKENETLQSKVDKMEARLQLLEAALTSKKD